VLHYYAAVDLIAVQLSEDPISSFFDLEMCPRVLNLPVDIDTQSGEILRKDPNFSLELVTDSYDMSEVALKELIDDLFYEHGRIRPHERIMCWFPKYLQYFIRSYKEIVVGSDDSKGVLKLEQKLYLGIMAVSCYKCDYLLNILEEQFVLVGGNLEWLADGLKKVDP
jgi:hypothetical protein